MGMIRPRPKIKSKDVTITENGESVISPDKYFNGMDKVNLTVDVAGGGDEYNTKVNTVFVPQKNTLIQNITEIPNIDTSSLTNAQYMFKDCTSLTKVPPLNTSKVTTFLGMFSDCASLESIPNMDTSSGINFQSMFNGCKNLRNIPVMNFSKATQSIALNYILYNTGTLLTDESLNNLMASLLTATNYAGEKTLKKVGFSTNYISRCQSLSNYQALLDAGWTTGY